MLSLPCIGQLRDSRAVPSATLEQPKVTQSLLRDMAARQSVSSSVKFDVSESPSADAGVEVGGSGSGAKKLKRVKAHAYTGEVVQRGWGSMVVDLSTLKVPANKDKLGMLFRHGGGWTESFMPVGVWDKFSIDESGVVLEGYFLEGDETADKIASAAKQGFPWDLSVGMTDGRLELIPFGTTRKVNGKELAGTPVDSWGCGGTYVLVNAYLREGSICEIGADPNTGAEYDLSSHQPKPKIQRGTMLARFLAAFGRGDVPGAVQAADEINAAELNHSSGDSAMSDAAKTPAPATATLAQLKALPGADNDFVVKALEQNLSVDAASGMLLGALNTKLTDLAKAHSEALAAMKDEHAKLTETKDGRIKELETQLAAAKGAGGAKPLELAGAAGGAASGGIKKLESLSGTDPEADYEASQELQDHWKGHGGKNAFIRNAKESLRVGDDYRVIAPWA